MSGTAVPYEHAAQAAYEAAGGEFDEHPGAAFPWTSLPAADQAAWGRVARATVKAFHAERKRQGPAGRRR